MITCLEAHISKLEVKTEITYSDSVRIRAHMERFISLDSDFKTHHFHINEVVDEEDEETLKREQAILDDHEDGMNEIMDCLTQLGHTKLTPTVVAPPRSLETVAELFQLSHQRLQCLESSLRSVKKKCRLSDLGTRPSC